MEALLTSALLATAGAAIGALVTHWLAVNREARRLMLEAKLKFVERQIEELYGPLAALLYEGRRTFQDLLEALGRDHVFPDDREIQEEELRTWLFWAEAEFLPRNGLIKDLLTTKAHLIEGSAFPDSYVEFFDHCNSWAVNHRRWKEQKITYRWRSRINWPNEFETQALATFQALKKKHAALIGALSTGK